MLRVMVPINANLEGWQQIIMMLNVNEMGLFYSTDSGNMLCFRDEVKKYPEEIRENETISQPLLI